jgi:pimeloyl-ACP methyl ester carboxylesterase
VTPVIKSVELSTGVTLPYVEQGDSTGIPVLLVHGYADSWRAFEPVLPHLPDSLHVFAFSQRGHGDATRPSNGYHPSDFAADIEAFMNTLLIESAVIVGASSGGITVQRFAIDHPARTLGLVFAGAPLTLRGNPEIAEFRNVVSQLSDPIDPDFVREFQQGTLVGSFSQAFLDGVVQESLKMPARIWKMTLDPLLDTDFSDELSSIKSPTLIIWGDRDTILPKSQQETFASAIAGAKLVVYPGAGHALYWEEPARFAADVANFVMGLAR